MTSVDWNLCNVDLCKSSVIFPLRSSSVLWSISWVHYITLLTTESCISVIISNSRLRWSPCRVLGGGGVYRAVRHLPRDGPLVC